MEKSINISGYHDSFVKRALDIALSLSGLIILSPLFLLILILTKLLNKGPVFFKQVRTGKNGKPFTLIKFRSMVRGAENEQDKYRFMNEADGPVFKIENDPRFTKFGKILAKTGLDELPQIINVLKGEMSLVGPRPLPVNEAKKLTLSQKKREFIRPGITSNWIVEGAHHLKFAEWMSLDRSYLENAGVMTDISVLLKTCLLISKLAAHTAGSLVENFHYNYRVSRAYATAFWLVLFILTLIGGVFILRAKGINISDAYSFK